MVLNQYWKEILSESKSIESQPRESRNTIFDSVLSFAGNQQDCERPQRTGAIQAKSLFRRFFCLPLIFPLNRFVHFLAMDGDFGRGFDPQPHLVAANIDDGDLDVVADENAFIALT